MDVQLEPHAEGVLLPVRAQPGARKNGVTGEHDGALKVSVTQAPEQGKANRALAAVIAKELRIRRSQVHLVNGETSRRKMFLLSQVDLSELSKQLEERLG